MSTETTEVIEQPLELPVVEHHLFGPSSLYRRGACPGSARMEMGLGDLTSDYAVRGSWGHFWLANPPLRKTIELNDNFDEELLEQCNDCLDYLDKILDEHSDTDLEVRYEERVTLTGNGGKEVSFGWADVVIFLGKELAIVIDWKFNLHPLVHDPITLQLEALGSMALQTYGLKEVYCVAFQAATTQEFKLNVSDLAPFSGRYNRIVENSSDPTVVLKASTESCQYCRALPTCCAAREQVTQIEGLRKMLSTEDPALLAYAYDVVEHYSHFADAAKKLIKGVSEHIDIPGRKRSVRRGRRYIQNNVDSLGALRKWVKDHAPDTANGTAPTLHPLEALELSSMPYSKIEKLLAEKFNVQKGEKKAFQDELASVLGENLKRSESSVVLMKTTKKPKDLDAERIGDSVINRYKLAQLKGGEDDS